MKGSSYLVEAPIRTGLDNLDGNVGPIGDSWKPQSADADGDTPLGALPLVVGNSELVTAVSGVKVLKRVWVGDGGDLDSDYEKRGEPERSTDVRWTNQSSAGERW